MATRKPKVGDPYIFRIAATGGPNYEIVELFERNGVPLVRAKSEVGVAHTPAGPAVLEQKATDLRYSTRLGGWYARGTLLSWAETELYRAARNGKVVDPDEHEEMIDVVAKLDPAALAPEIRTALCERFGAARAVAKQRATPGLTLTAKDKLALGEQTLGLLIAARSTN